MNVTEAVTSRRSVRDFLDKPVDKAIIERVLETAQRAPSGGNTQPWNALVVGGDALVDLTAKIKAKAKEAPMGEGMEYAIYPAELEGRYEDQRRAVGRDMFESIGLAREDKMGRIEQMFKNWDSFGAPVQLFTYTRKYMGPPQWSDMGMWLQTVMLLLREEGLDSCSQEIWAMYGTYMRELLNIDDDHIFFCGMAIGYRDPDAPINNFSVPRVALDEAVEFRGF
ncbi:Nitroreductase [Parasphingorhabdus marina DSM 22363]|uniref:Nitroreductase n=1 Tax=Parasphingorhabdus marina DSM 22363 TaxID=1123272 RepID=A0A1N6GYS3_9SPHN|nr:nitroreductase [Parasphingorhabdus marina]SIO12718.1 Nitroreductase [Parasphingorhabdus marina DSM 22363]